MSKDGPDQPPETVVPSSTGSEGVFGGKTDTPPIDLHDPTLVLAEDPSAPSVSLAVLRNEGERYTDFMPLGEGGMATVQTCRDPHLGRDVALKRLHPHLGVRSDMRTQFVREARIMAQLEHPNILPVHELGMREDRSVYFTMKRIKGATLQHILRDLSSKKPATVQAYPFSRLLVIFIDVCQAVAFAHNRQVVHRDLKPANILVGSFGEVLVMDWGMAKVLGAPDAEPEEDSVSEWLEEMEETHTIHGTVKGTPEYMSPEQALGQNDTLDARSDQFSLGSILYELITLRQTTQELSVAETLRAVKEDPVVPPCKAVRGLCLAPELTAICMKTLAKDPAERYPSVRDLIADLKNYQDGKSVSMYRDPLPRRMLKWCRRHPIVTTTCLVALIATTLTFSSLLAARNARIAGFLNTAETHRAEGNRVYDEKIAAAAELEALRQMLVLKHVHPREEELAARVDALHRESENYHDLAEALYAQVGNMGSREVSYVGLRDIFDRRMAYALAARRYDEAKKWMGMMYKAVGEDFEGAPPQMRAWMRKWEERLEGAGVLKVVSRPAGASIILRPLADDGTGRSVSGDVRDLGHSPTEPLPVPKGSYLLELVLEGRPLVRAPVFIGHGQPWTAQIYVPPEVPEGMVFVPGGPVLIGGKEARSYRLHEQVLPGFFIKAHEVTFGEYVAYWLASGRGEADRSRVRLSREERVFVDAWDDAGELRAPYAADLPVVGITQAAAERYCAWKGKPLNRACRLPTAEEWEKAARGVDGRAFVWGDGLNAVEVLTVENSAGHERFPMFAPPGSFPDDRSVYGVFDLAGNVREWTGSRFPEGSPYFQIKGASAFVTHDFLYCSNASDTPVAPSDVGFRFVLEVE